jgi:hypothetical protein
MITEPVPVLDEWMGSNCNTSKVTYGLNCFFRGHSLFNIFPYAQCNDVPLAGGYLCCRYHKDVFEIL